MFEKKYVAADIGNHNIKLVCGYVNKERFIIDEYAIIDTPANSIKDGKITNAKALAGAISEVMEMNGMKGKNLILNITGTGVITRDVQLPRSTEEELEKMLQYEAQQYFPVDLENYVMDFKVLEELENTDAALSRVLLVAVPLKQVNEYMKLPGLLKMNLSAIDLPANCVMKFLFSGGVEVAGSSKELQEEFAVVDIGSETTGVCIFSGNKLMFSRILLNGSNEIDKLISYEYGVDFKRAEKEKINMDRLVNEDFVQDQVNERLAMVEYIKPAVNNLLEDINRFIEFYNSRGTGKRLKKIVIFGGGSKLNGLESYMSSYFNLPVEYLRNVENVLYKGKKGLAKFQEDFVYLINAAGALVRR